VEALEAVTFLPAGLTRQVAGETLNFDGILKSIFWKAANSLQWEIFEAKRTRTKVAKWHGLMLLVDTFNIYAHNYPVESRSVNIARFAELCTQLRDAVPESFLVDHTFTGIRFDETNETWLETKPVLLPNFIPINHERRSGASQAQPIGVPTREGTSH
jgi:hypothetical protein